ncbi:lytic transglycosylase domain-containing protein [Candidatus Odyssella thessalonicensis]|uniref:lytic transglycosylase domain-containing protein n=1 Tax=Candidatus Odyssella thessalonicensis TaxID=84647 RepID=UPI000225B942|nr:lytic transglycosylase domain-containing protein [Candidatus Odyssella thessalonicensis]
MRQLSLSFLILSLTLSQNYANEAAKCGAQLKKAIRLSPEGVTINQGQCPKSYTLLMWLKAQKTANFSQARAFLEKHPNWPRSTAIQRQIEKQLYESITPATQIISWFRQLPPISLKGLKAFGQALLAQNQHDDQKFRQAFIAIEMGQKDLKELIKSYRPLLPEETLLVKVHDLLDKNQLPAAEVISPVLKPQLRKEIETRLQIIKGAPVLTSDNPRIAFEQARFYRKHRQDQKAAESLQHLANHPSPEAVWVERNLIARRLLEDKKYQAAYDTIKDHGLKKGENFANAEWLAGWLCLRFLKNPEQAKEHFEHLNESVSTPVSVARAQYWLGRAEKDLSNQAQAQMWWQKAQKHIATYYGQLAHKELNGKMPAPKLKLAKFDASVRRSLEGRELFAYMRLLQEIKETALAEAFALSLGEQLKSPEEQALLAQIVHETAGKHQGLKVYKKIMKTDYPLIPAAYPRLNYVPQQVIEPAFAHAIIRQESRFQHDAVSSAGAKGLMQLMPATAALTEKRYKIKRKNLTDPHHNVRLGSYHLKDLMDKYRGSIILVAAAYNAGSAAVDRWIEDFGDPRSGQVNVIDWVESIPYAETRNYVQRVLENYHCYRCH